MVGKDYAKIYFFWSGKCKFEIKDEDVSASNASNDIDTLCAQLKQVESNIKV